MDSASTTLLWACILTYALSQSLVSAYPSHGGKQCRHSGCSTWPSSRAIAATIAADDRDELGRLPYLLQAHVVALERSLEISDRQHNAQINTLDATGSSFLQARVPSVGLIVGLLVFIAVFVGLTWFCCRSLSQGSDIQRFSKQIFALSRKNARINTRTALPSCRCCNVCCLQVLVPIGYLVLLTVVPNLIIRFMDVPVKDLVTDHEMEYGRNYSDAKVWVEPNRVILDYLFQEPRISELQAELRGQWTKAGVANLWWGGGTFPAGACFCRTLAFVGPRAPKLKAYFQKRYAEYKSSKPKPSLADMLAMQRECPAENKLTLFQVFNSTSSFEAWTQEIKYGEINADRGRRHQKDRICGAVILGNDPMLSRVPKFEVRTNVTGVDITGLVAKKVIVPILQSMEDRVVAPSWYLASGFISIQDLVQGFLLQTRVGSNIHPPEIDFLPLPAEPYYHNSFTSVLQNVVKSPISGAIMMAVNIMSISYFMIRERNTRQKELMRLMGLYDSSLTFSWVLLYAAFNLTVAILGAFIVVIMLAGNSSFLVLFLIFFLCAMATTMMGMIVSSLFSTERLGALVAFGLYNILGLLYYGLTISSTESSSSAGLYGDDFSSGITRGQLYIVSIVPPVAMTLSLQTYFALDQTPVGCTLQSAFDSSARKFSVGGGVIMLLIDVCFYGLLYMYLDQVVQQDVGVARPWYFPFTRSFWLEMLSAGEPRTAMNVGQNPPEGSVGSDGGSVGSDEGVMPAEYFESEAADYLQAKERIMVRGLRKEFTNAAGILVQAVNGLNLTMYEGECFCLLGHNGAGKSTTMAIITGMMPPTAGEVHVRGKRMPEHKMEIRSQMGFCMQQNVLWDTLTVEEHIHLFGALMGVDASRTEVLKVVDLNAKRQAEAATLSGGMKRKLNVALALLGDAPVVLLDEPTAGMDPHTRRQLWDVLKEKRLSRIMCLTTHHMDEADELGDRICVMVNGRAACSGTNAFLKRQLGCGYVLSFVKRNESVPDGSIIGLVQKHCGENVSIFSSGGRELRLRVPFAEASAFPMLMQGLDKSLDSLRLESYGVGVSDLEDVFLRVAAGEEVTKKGQPGNGHQGGGSSQEDAAASQKATGVHDELSPTFFRQFIGLTQRRIRYGRRDRRMFLCQVFMPILIMAIFLSIQRAAFSQSLSLAFPPVVMNTEGWREQLGPPLVSVGVVDGGIGAKIGEAWQEHPPPGVAAVRLNKSLHLNVSAIPPRGLPAAATMEHHRARQLLEEMSFADFAYNIAHGPIANPPQFGGLLYAGNRTTIFMNTSALYAAPTLLNMHFTALLASLPQRKREGEARHGKRLEQVEVIGKPLDATFSEAQTAQTVNSFTIGIVLLVAYSYIPTGIAAYVAMEKEVEVKNQLMVSGTNRAAYWLSNFLFDSIFGTVSLAGTLILLQVFDADDWLSYPNIKATVMLLVLFTPAASVSAYFMSMFFNSSGAALVGTLVLGLVGGNVGLNMSSVLMVISNTHKLGYALLWTSRFLFPATCVGSGLMRLALWREVSKQIGMGPFAGFVFGTDFCPSYLGGQCIFNAGDDIFMLALDTVVFAFLTLLVDMYSETFALRYLLGVHGESRCPAELLQEDDPQVREEKLRIEDLKARHLLDKQVLFVDDVHKSFGNNVHAVRGITYAVAAGEVFGLLGVNGAGKTTTFKMMCGQLRPSAGTILLNGVDVTQNLTAIRKQIGYCPQFNALLDLLTVREHLELYAQVKGVAGKELEAEVAEKLKTFDMSKFEHTRAAQLSGGNMRKLSCALAMVGEPPVIFLDEPSAGMDPVARRFMWGVIQSIAQRRTSGSAVILTTHSLDEADALCTRIAIQTSGQVRCLGTPQQLKERYGTGLELNVRLGTPNQKFKETLCRHWGQQLEQMCPIEEASQLAIGYAHDNSICGPLAEGSLPITGNADAIESSALAEWCLSMLLLERLTQALQSRCGGAESVYLAEPPAAGAFRFRLVGSALGGGPKPYGELFSLLQDACDGKLFELPYTPGIKDFQLSQGTLERTFNRLASEDIQRNAEELEKHSSEGEA